MSTKYEWSLLILRITVGVTFTLHGISKFQGGIDQFIMWFVSLGLPSLLAYGVVFLEIIGGISLIIGLGSKVFATLFSFLMIGAIITVKWANGFLGSDQGTGYELDVLLLTMSVALIVSGSQRFSLDARLAKSENEIIPRN